MTTPPRSVRFVSDCFVKPPQPPRQFDHSLQLPPWDLAMLSVHYIQKGLLFTLPPRYLEPGFDRPAFIHSFLEKLKRSLSSALYHFYLLAGRLATLKQPDPRFYTVDCANGPGARFIHAALDMTMADILSPTYVPAIVQSFDHDRAINHDRHALPLLSMQVTELADGVFIRLSMNHPVGAGTSFWLFFNSWSETFQAQEKGAVEVVQLSHPPVLTRWFPENHPGPLSLPHTDDPLSFLTRFEAPELREQLFHFSADAIAGLKVEANRQCSTTNISSFQSLTALVLHHARPPLPAQPGHKLPDGCKQPGKAGPPAPARIVRKLDRTIEDGGDGGGAARQWPWLGGAAAARGGGSAQQGEAARVERGVDKEATQVYHLDKTFDQYSIMMGSSRRFNKYGNDFGLGKAVALRSGYANKFDGKVSANPGHEGGGSIDLEICLPPATMAVLEADAEFMAAVTVA